MIASQYGWTDETILDLPIRRLRQVTATITERQRGEEDVKQAYLEWQTKVLASFIAGTANSGKAVKSLMRAVKHIHLRPVEDDEEEAPALTDAQGRLTWDPENPPIPDTLPDPRAVLGMFGPRMEPPREGDA